MDGTVGPKVAASGTVLSPGDNFAEIHHGEKYVVAYLPTSRFYSIDPGEQVVIPMASIDRAACPEESG